MMYKQKDFVKADHTLPNGKRLVFYHNLPDIPGLSIEGDILNWFFTTNKHTVDSLAQYVENKGLDYKVITLLAYEKLTL